MRGAVSKFGVPCDETNTRLLTTELFDITTHKMSTELIAYVFSYKGEPERQILVGCLGYSTDTDVINNYSYDADFHGPDVKRMLPMILVYINRLQMEFKKVMDTLCRPHLRDEGNSLQKRRRVDTSDC